MKFNIIGAGRLGKNIALSLVTFGNELVAVCNRNLHSAVAAVDELGAGVAVETITDLPSVDITFITSPDDCIADIAAQLTGASSIVVHCSGALGSDVLAPLKDHGCSVACIHPFKSFRNNNIQANAFKDCTCVVEGNARAVQLLTVLFTKMGAHVLSISADKKSTYHAAAVMASNYVVTLAGSAMALLIDAGLSEMQAKAMTQQMMQGSLINLQDTTHVTEALTGPLARGDLNTINRHLQAIKSAHIDALYRAAGLATLPLTKLDDETMRTLMNRLNER